MLIWLLLKIHFKKWVYWDKNVGVFKGLPRPEERLFPCPQPPELFVIVYLTTHFPASHIVLIFVNLIDWKDFSFVLIDNSLLEGLSFPPPNKFGIKQTKKNQWVKFNNTLTDAEGRPNFNILRLISIKSPDHTSPN